MQPTQPNPTQLKTTLPPPDELPALRYSPDVVTRMKATGVDPAASEKRLAALPRDQAETTWSNVMDYYRRNTDISSKVAAHQGAGKDYQQARMREPENPSWTAFDDLGNSFKNSFIDLAQGVSDFVPSTVDLAMSSLSNPSDDSWYRKWDKATDEYFAKAKYYVSPEAQAAVYDEKTGLNWRAVAGMTGQTLGFLTTTMLPVVGALGRGAEVSQALSAGSKIVRVLTDPRLQSGVIGYLQALPGYKESALQAGYTRNQAALIAPILSTAQSVLEFAGADALIKAVKLTPAEAMAVVRQLGKESAVDAFKSLAGKPLSEETFREVVNATGKGFFDRLKAPEVRRAILKNIRAGAATEGLEELTQQAAESAIRKMADTYYGYDAVGGKGFDPTLKQTLIQSVTGVLMGGIVGGSMGGMLGRTPTHVGQQTVWGKLDGDVRNLIANHPDLDLSNNKEGLPLYRLTDKLLEEGKLTEPEHQQAREGLDQMVNISARLAKTSSDTPTRFALYNLDNEQKQWAARLETEVQIPLQRLSQLANESEPGVWTPKTGLNTLDLAEAQDLINQNLPRKAQLADTIEKTIRQSVVELMNPDTRSQTLKAYRPQLDALAEAWNKPIQANAPAQPDQYAEADVPGLVSTMDTPNGRFAMAITKNGDREVFRVENQIDGARGEILEDKDPIVGRFRGYQLPTKGQPAVHLYTIADQTRHDEILDAFDQNPDLVKPYGEWRSELQENFSDDSLQNLEQVRKLVNDEASQLGNDPASSDWQKGDLARKQQWIRQGFQQLAENPGETRYNPDQYIADHHNDWLSANHIEPADLITLPDQYQNSLYDALRSGNTIEASKLARAAFPLNQLLNPHDSESSPSALLAKFENETGRVARRQLVKQLTEALSGREQILENVRDYLSQPAPDSAVEQRITSQLAELAAYQRQLTDAVEQIVTEQPSDENGVATGTGEPAPADKTRGRSTTRKTNTNAAAGATRPNLVGFPIAGTIVKTAKGSSYTYLPDGKTQRFKQTENKQQSPQDLLVYVPDAATIKVNSPKGSLFKTMSESEIEQELLDYVQGKDSFVNVVDEQGNKIETNYVAANANQLFLAVGNRASQSPDFVIPVSLQPKDGYYTYDSRLYNENGQQYRERHLGNKVVSITIPTESTTLKKKPKAYDPLLRDPQTLQESILQYFVGKGRIRTDDLRRYGDPNWMKGPNGGNPLISYVTSDPNNAPSLDSLARELSDGFPESADEQAVMQQIIDTLSSFPSQSPKGQLISLQQEPIDQQMSQDISEFTPLQVLSSLFEAMDKAGINNTIQEELVRTIETDHVTADGLDWLGVYKLLDKQGFLNDPQLKSFIVDEYLNQIAPYIILTEAELAEAEQLTPDDIQELIHGPSLSNEVFQLLIEAHALTNEQVDELNRILGEQNPNLPDESDILFPEPAGQTESDTGSSNGSSENETAGISGQASQTDSAATAPPGSEFGRTESVGDANALIAESPTIRESAGKALSPFVQQAIEQAKVESDQALTALDGQTKHLQNKIDDLKRQVKKRTATAVLDFGTQPTVGYPVATIRPYQFTANAIGINPDGSLMRGTLSTEVSPTTSIQLTGDASAGYQGYIVNVNAKGVRIGRLATYRNYMIEPAFDKVEFNQVSDPNAVTDIVTIRPAEFNGDGSLKKKGLVFYEQNQSYEQWRTARQTPQQTDLATGQVTGLEAEQVAKRTIQELELELNALQQRRINLESEKQKVIDVARQIAETQQNLFPESSPPVTQQAISNETIETGNEVIAAQELDNHLPEREVSDEPLSIEQQAEAQETLEKLQDFGQKIGAARKDLAVTGFKLAKETDKQPSWAKKYKVFADKNETFNVARVNGSFMRTLQRGFKTEAQAADAIPLIEVSSNHRVYQKAPGNFAVYRVYSNGKVWDVADGFASREDGMHYMAQNALEIINKKSPILERPHLDKVSRTLKDHRSGKNVTPQQLLDVFGFRGGEFGNWLAADERQFILNMAYDAFMDLAEVLNLPPRALSMGGELSIGFGSRGKGLSGAAAHYETSRAVINLTKIRGAGSLAHEWFHAFDNYLAKQDGKTPSQRNMEGHFDVPSKERAYFSHGPSLAQSGVRTELAKSFNAVWKVLSEKTIERNRDINKTVGQVEKTKELLDKRLTELRLSIAQERQFGKSKKAATPEQLSRFDELATKLTMGELGERQWFAKEKSKFSGDYYFPGEKALYDIIREVTGRKVGDYSIVSPELVRYQRALQEHDRATSGQSETSQVKTDFVKNAQKLDKSRATPYWSSPHELMARAFESYVQDQIARQGESQYLIHGADNLFYALFDEKPYPEGQERLDIDQTFDHLFKVIETKPNADGNTVMMQHGTNPSLIPLTENLVNSLQSFLTNANFANRLSGTEFDQAAFDRAALEAGLKTDKLTGFRVGNQIYLNPSRLNAQTAMHELGHVWASMMRQQNPAVLDRGLSLMAATRYESKFKENKAYQKRDGESPEEYSARIREEALVEAIADKGAKILSSERQTKFRQFLSDFWNGIKRVLASAGINIQTKAKSLADATLEEYTQAIASQMISGQPVTGVLGPDMDSRIHKLQQVDAQYQPTDQPIMPVQNSEAKAISEFRIQTQSKAFQDSLKALPISDIAHTLQTTYASIVSQLITLFPSGKVANSLTKTRSVGVFKNQPGVLFDLPTGRFNVNSLNDVARLIKGQPIQYGQQTKKLRDLFFKGDIVDDWRKATADRAIINEHGNYETLDIESETQDLRTAIDVLTNPNDNPFAKYAKRILTSSWFAGILSPEVVGRILSIDPHGSFRRMLTSIRQAWQFRQDEVALRRDAQLTKLDEAFKELSVFGARDPRGNVKRLRVNGWVNGKAGQINMTIDEAIDLYMTAKTQLTHTQDLAKYPAGISSVIAEFDDSGNFVDKRQGFKEGDKIDLGAYGYVHESVDRQAANRETWLIDRPTYEQLEKTLQTDYKEAIDALQTVYSDQVAQHYVSELYQLENGAEFTFVQNYYPTQGYQFAAAAKVVPQFGTLLEESRILQKRTLPPLLIQGMSALSRVRSYTRTEGTYIGNSAVRLNLSRWLERHKVQLDKAPTYLITYLKDLEKDLNNPGDRYREAEKGLESSFRGIDIGPKAWLKRFTRATFAFKLTTPLIQIASYTGAYGMGIIDTKYLNQALPILAELGLDSYRIAKQDATRDAFGELAETKYLEKIAENPYMKSVLYRLIGDTEAFLGSPSLEDIKTAPVDAGIAVARKAVHAISDYGLRWIRAADRSMLIAFEQAAEYQVADQVTNGQLLDENGQSVTDVHSTAALKEVARLAMALMEKTNTTNGEATKSALQRNRSFAGSLIGLYSGQQQRLASTVISGFVDYMQARHDPNVTPDQAHELLMRAAWSGTNLILFNAMSVALINGVYRALTHDEDKEASDYVASFGMDVARNAVGSIPSFPTEALVSLSTMVDSEPWSEEMLSYPPAEAFATLNKGLIAGVQYLNEEDEQKRDKRWNTMTYGLVSGGTKLIGLPNALPTLLQHLSKKEKQPTPGLIDVDQ